MESFAAVVRSLLARIRALETSPTSSQWPPSAAAASASPVYQVEPTAWGVDRDAESLAGARSAAAAPGVTTATADAPAAKPRRLFEISPFGLPVPRGLPAT